MGYEDDSNEKLFSRLFGYGFAWALARTGSLNELIRRAEAGDGEAANYLIQYEEKQEAKRRRPRLHINIKLDL